MVKSKIQNFGPHEKLTDRLRSLLAGYKDGIAIFKELIQNADDATASVVKFCYDKRSNDAWTNAEKLFDPAMAKLQGQSLFVFNDALFTDSDFENLSKLGGATKLNKKDKVGKFGLGFCSVYNITDVPSIISGHTFVVFDPNIKYLDSQIKDRSMPGIRIDFEAEPEKVGEFCDQFKPYENMFGTRLFEKDSCYLEGTLMRLPLRNEPSEITSHVYNNHEEIASLFKILYTNADILLLFTQHVRKVEFYMLDDDDSDMKLLFKFEKSPLANLNRAWVI